MMQRKRKEVPRQKYRYCRAYVAHHSYNAALHNAHCAVLPRSHKGKKRCRHNVCRWAAFNYNCHMPFHQHCRSPIRPFRCKQLRKNGISVALGKLLKRARVKNIHGIHACKAALNFIHQRFIRYPFAVHYCRAGAALLAVCAQLHYQIIRAHAASDKRYVCPQVFYKPLLRAFHDFFIAGLLYAAVLIAASVHIKRRRLPLNEHGSTAIHYGCFYCVPACFLLHFRHGEHIICNVFNKRRIIRQFPFGYSLPQYKIAH